jgi:hypothetical protein
MVCIDATQLRPIAGDSERAQAVKVVACAHQTLIWKRTRTFQRLRNTLREYFPGALAAYAGAGGPVVCGLWVVGGFVVGGGWWGVLVWVGGWLVGWCGLWGVVGGDFVVDGGSSVGGEVE